MPAADVVGVLDAVLARADAEYDDVCLWVLVENTRARRYYERRGGERDGACRKAAPGVAEQRWRRSAPHQSL